MTGIRLKSIVKIPANIVGEGGVTVDNSGGTVTIGIDPAQIPSGFNWRGPWSSVANYEINDAVGHEGASYIAIAANLNSEPPGADWDVMAQASSSPVVDDQITPAMLDADTAPKQLLFRDRLNVVSRDDDQITPVMLDADTSPKQLAFRDRLNFVSRAGDAMTGALVVSGHMNFGTVSGDSGYGFRDSSGIMQAKNSAGSWSPFLSATDLGLVQGGTSPILQSVIANAKHQVFVTQFAACAGNDAVDDSIGINNAIDYLASLNGGALIFNPGDQARIKNPIILKQGVYLYGMTGPHHHDTSAFRAHIRAAANLTAMVTTADTTVATHSCGLIGMVLDGNKDSFTVSALVKIAMLNSRIENCHVGNGSGHGIWATQSTGNISWINWITGNSIDLFPTGTGILFYGTDSVISGNYISTCQDGAKIIGSSNVRVIGNHFELCTQVGLTCRTPDSGASNTSATAIVGNTFTFCENGLVFDKGSIGATATIHGPVVGNIFTTGTVRDIFIASGLVDGVIGDNNFRGSTPSNGNIDFASTASTGWAVDGCPGISITGPPTDLKTRYLSWRLFTPTVTSVLGTITVFSSGMLYQVNGNRCTFNGNISISALGDGSAASSRMKFTLPVACRNSSPAGYAGGVNTTTGVAVSGIVNFDTGLGSLFKSDGSFPVAVGQTVWFSGSYEIA